MRFRSRITSRWIALVSIDSGRPSRSRAKWLSAAASSAARVVGLLGEQPARHRDVARREHVEGKPHVVHHAGMEVADFLQAFGREGVAVLDLLGGQFHQVLVDDVADMLEIGREGDDLDIALAFLVASSRTSRP